MTCLVLLIPSYLASFVADGPTKAADGEDSDGPPRRLDEELRNEKRRAYRDADVHALRNRNREAIP